MKRSSIMTPLAFITFFLSLLYIIIGANTTPAEPTHQILIAFVIMVITGAIAVLIPIFDHHKLGPPTHSVNLEDLITIFAMEAESVKYKGSDRYILVEEGINGSEYYNFSIIDTSQGHVKGFDYWRQVVCEISKKEDAVLICYLLNNNYLVK